MKKETLYEVILDINENYVKYAREGKPKEKKSRWLRWTALAACLCLVLGLGMFLLTPSGGSVILGGSHELLPSHREDFYPREVDPIFREQLGEDVEITIIYRTLQNEWYLSKELTEISQALQPEPFYVDASSAKEYVYYQIEENQVKEWCSASKNIAFAQGLFGLTQARIDSLLTGLEYEDYYVIDYAQYNLVFLWVRGVGEDLFVSCQTDSFIDFEDGGVYTLEEVQEILSQFYYESTGIRGEAVYWYQHLKMILKEFFLRFVA